MIVLTSLLPLGVSTALSNVRFMRNPYNVALKPILFRVICFRGDILLNSFFNSITLKLRLGWTDPANIFPDDFMFWWRENIKVLYECFCRIIDCWWASLTGVSCIIVCEDIYIPPPDHDVAAPAAQTAAARHQKPDNVSSIQPLRWFSQFYF